jgi:hypothetical protein
MKRISTALFISLALAGCATVNTSPSVDALSYLSAIVFPETDFEDAAMSDLIEYLRGNTRCMCHDAFHTFQKIEGDRVSYTLRYCPYDAHDRDSADCILSASGYPPEFECLGPSITLKTGEISLDEYLRRITSLANGTIESDRSTIVIRVKKVSPPESALNDPFR